jgi:predicted PurR-regulated permease PerM
LDLPVKDQPKTAFAQRTLIIAAVAALLFLAWQVASVFVLVFAGVLVAVLLRGVSDPLARATALPERWALVVVVAAVLILSGGALYLLGERLGGQFSQLATQLPDAWSQAKSMLQQSTIGKHFLERLESGGSFGSPLSQIGNIASGTVGALADVVLILFLSLFLAGDPQLYKQGSLRLLPPRARPRWGKALDEAGDALRRWLMGQLVAMTCVGVLTGLGLWMLGIPGALSLGILAGVLDFVPFIGPFIAALPAVLLAVMQGPVVALQVALLYLVVQQIEGNVVVPLAQRWAVSMPPIAHYRERRRFRVALWLCRPVVRNPIDGRRNGAGEKALRRGDARSGQ